MSFKVYPIKAALRLSERFTKTLLPCLDKTETHAFEMAGGTA